MDRSLIWLGGGERLGKHSAVVRQAAEVVLERVVYDGEREAEAIIRGQGWHVVLRAERREGDPDDRKPAGR